MWLMARVIKSMGLKWWVKEQMNFGGTCIFTKLQMLKNFTEETVRKLSKLHVCIASCNKSLAAWGIEGRVPF
jgi:hypothetical protein